MGTAWSVTLEGDVEQETSVLQKAFQAAVDDVDGQMSTWDPASDLMGLNAAPLDSWVPLPSQLLEVLDAGLSVSARTGGAFEMNVGDAVQAWGFGAAEIDLDAIQAASQCVRVCATDALELDVPNRRARKTMPLALDLSGIAKGYGVDCLAAVAEQHGLQHALCGLDGELRAVGTRANGAPWSVGVEMPDATGGAHSVVDMANTALATSGDYRHFVDVKGTRLSHTMDPRRGSPKVGAPASVSVLADTCMAADAMATALMVMGAREGSAFAREHGIDALFLLRADAGIAASGTGIFS